MKIKEAGPNLGILLLCLSLGFSGCVTPAPAPALTSLPASTLPPTLTKTAIPMSTLTPTPVIPTSIPIPTKPITVPTITLNQGDYYFTVDGRQSFIYVRNLAGYQPDQYIQLLDLMKGKGVQVVRIQLDSLGMGYDNTGTLDKNWALSWERIFARAAQDGLAVLPVFTGWFDWNNGDPDYDYSMWKSNPLRIENKGPAKTPAALFQAGSSTQRAWLGWLKTLVERWQAQENIIAWEIFSEVNLASGVTERSGIDFIEKAAKVIRLADPRQRPITASLAETGDWSNFYNSEAIDFINTHPYPPSGQLDREIIRIVRAYQGKYHKPVFIGESGLSFVAPTENSNTLTTATNARLGIEHAIWAGMVSGAMDGRALYWEDSFAIYFPRLSWLFLLQYLDAESIASQFVSSVDFSGFQPLEAHFSNDLFGAAIGNESTILGWFRDASCEPPDWQLQSLVSKGTVSLPVPGASAWQLNFYSPSTGEWISDPQVVQPEGDTLQIVLPAFIDTIAFKLTAQ